MAKEKARYVYRGGDRTTESVVRRSKQGSGNYDSFLTSEVTMFKPREGENTIRILPPTWKDFDKWGDGWEISVVLHYGIGPDKASYLCLDKMKGEECPVCAARANTTDDEERDALRSSSRQLAWVIDRDNEKAGPMVWSIPTSLFRDINARSVDKKTNTPILVDDPEFGFDVVFTREGTALKTKYVGVEVVRDSSPLHDNQKKLDQWLAYVMEHPLPELLNYFEADHIERALLGKAASRKRTDDEDEDESPKRSSRRAGDEDEDEDESPKRSSRRARGEDEDEDEEPPKRTSRRARDADEDEEDDTPKRSSRRARDEDDDEDEDDTPKRSSRRAAKDDDEDEEEAAEPKKEGGRVARRRLLDADDEEPPFDTKGSKRRAAKDEDEDEEDDTVSSARASLSRVKNTRGR